MAQDNLHRTGLAVDMPAPWYARLAALRDRQTWVLVHRWVGLVMAGFLIVAALTGSVLVFYDELEALLNPQTHQVEPPYEGAPILDMVTLRDRALAARPEAWTDSALAPWKPGRSLSLWVRAREDGARIDGELFVDPYTGEVLGSRRWGDISQGRINLMPFIYRLHESLALGTVGTYTFGIIALLWTLDCFVGAYLTLPRGRPFWQKWKPAWGIKRKRFNYDLHRASGLWTWAMLFVFAWSTVALNLREVYYPVTGAVFRFAESAPLPVRDIEQPEPGMAWHDAYARGQVLMQPALADHGIGEYREDALRYNRRRAEFAYWIATKFKNGDEAYDWFGVIFDANTGELLRIDEENTGPQHERAGDFITRWLIDLHMAKVWGLPFRIFVFIMGIVVTALSITGVVIWWRKRRSRAAPKVAKKTKAGNATGVARPV